MARSLRKFIEILKKIYNFGDEFITRVEKHHLFLIAAGIAFNIALYLLPMFLVAVYVVNLFIGDIDLSETLTSITDDFLPPTQQSFELLQEVISEVQNIMDHSSLFGWVSLFALLWISSALISSIRSGLNTIFHFPSPKIFILYRLKDVMLIILITVFIFLYSFVLPIVSFSVTLIENMLPENLLWLFTGFVFTSISLITSFCLIYIIFWLVPNKPIPPKIRIWATLLCVVLIEFSRRAFAWYVTGVSSYGKFYGAYAAIVTAGVWIYYSSLIILLSAEFINYLFDKKTKEKYIE